MGDIDPALVLRFSSEAGCDEQQARFFLEAASGVYDAALQMYLENVTGVGGADLQRQQNLPPQVHDQYNHQLHQQLQQQYGGYGLPQTRVPTVAAPLPPRPRAPLAPVPAHPAAPHRAVAHAHQQNLLGMALSLPLAVTRISFRLLSNSVLFGATVAAFVGDRILPPRIMNIARGIVGSVQSAVAHRELDPSAQAAAFITSFKAAYGDRHPRWVESSCKQATATAAREAKFLFVYLHAPQHQDTDPFCTNVLCHPDVVDYVNTHFVAWGGDISRSDAYMLSLRLAASTYPYLALLASAPGASGRVQLVAAMQGNLSAEQLLAGLMRGVHDQGAMLVAQRADREAQDLDRRLRDEQNAEYEASLAADREREASRAAESAAAAEAQRLIDEEAAAVRAVQEAEAKRIADAVAAIDRRRQEKRALLSAEPALDVPGAHVRVRLPDGSNHQRRFAASCPISVLYDYVDSLDATTFWTYRLVSNFPRKVLGPDLASRTLAEEGLAPQATLFVQPEDVAAAPL